MKGIILAGGKGTRLKPATNVTNKHLIPILNKPMVLFPLETLTSFGIEDVLLVSGGSHIGDFADFLGDGSEYGVNLTYKVQKEAGGIAEALGLAKDFAAGGEILVILGDNIFGSLRNVRLGERACLFLKEVADPRRFGVAKFDRKGNLTGIVEKPSKAPSRFAVTGLYKYPNEVFDVIPTLKRSKRGELEITDVNNHFVRKGCDFIKLKAFWSDAGTPRSLAEAVSWELKRLRAGEKAG